MRPVTRWVLGATLGVVALDQLTKWATRATLRERVDEFEVIPGWFAFANAQNKGAAFSALADNEHRILIFLTFTALAVVVIVVASRMLAATDRWAGAAVGTLLAGALGNAIDRAAFGQVTDMFKVSAGSGPLREWAVANFHTNVWPIFNIADIAIWVGVIGFPLAWLFLSPRGDPAEQHAAAEGSRPTLE